MKSIRSHPLVERYLNDLERALEDLPAGRRHDIVEDIRQHLQEAVGDASDEGTVREVLDRLGDPEAIAAEAREGLGAEQRRGGALEGVAIAALLVGGLIIPLAGWFIGVIALWISRVWTTRDKLIGTFLVPGGLALPMFLSAFAMSAGHSCSMEVEMRTGVSRQVCAPDSVVSDVLGTVLLVALVVVPIGTAIYLGRRAFKR